ncbi:MAG TPA: flavodoxin [Candidatus Avidehalobacter gallistercoris]|uniref:Flavodoxin n=1 Tax=Candidatus Avidehalobacter gallistercoris TaxID=2840694 RepID=A0A9D1HKL2_9FIRM|nr:flavodoxin [Candidatus Avidehalobacter gallistercoris]
MKKYFLGIVALVLLFALTSCAGSDQNDTSTSSQGNDNVQTGNSLSTEAENGDSAESTEPEILVAYFSATNNTAGIAADIAESLDADLYAITPAEAYTAADLDYNNDNSRTSIEMNDPDSRPAIGGDSVENMADYNIVFIGYPIWWGQAPRIISSFMESYDFSGKTIVPFCTSGSSDIGSSAANLQTLTVDAVWLAGQRFSSNASHDSIVEWLNSLAINVSAE